MFRVILGCIFVTLTSAVIHIPSYLVPCSKTRNFTTCAMKHAVDAIPHLLNGDQKLGIPKFTPLHITAIDIHGANNFNVNLHKLKVYGLEHAKPLQLKVDFKKRVAKILSTVPRLVVLGDYKISGKILIFTLNGHGPVNITLTNGLYEYGFEWTTENKDGLDYGKITKSNFDYQLSGVEYHFDNVITGDKVLSEQINRMLNKNWRDVNDDLKESICETLLIIHNQLFEKIFTQIPLKELFLD